MVDHEQTPAENKDIFWRHLIIPHKVEAEIFGPLLIKDLISMPNPLRPAEIQQIALKFSDFYLATSSKTSEAIELFLERIQGLTSTQFRNLMPFAKLLGARGMEAKLRGKGWRKVSSYWRKHCEFVCKLFSCEFVCKFT